MPEKFSPPTTCMKCGGAMEAGAFVGGNVSPAQAGIFVEGTPSAVKWWKVEPREQKGLLSGKVSKGLALVVPEGGPHLVLHYHCSVCGFLEAYATTADRL
jgi:hypothetical protein